MRLLLPPFILLSTLLTSCGGPFGKVSFEKSPQIINVSSFDPKERQTKGDSYSTSNQAALVKNGSLGLIARCGKGLVNDTKCGDFLVGAEKQNSLLGTYYFVRANKNITQQADHYIRRLRELKKSRGLKTKKVLLVADIDTHCNATQIITFIERIETLTGVTPVIYLENSKELIARLSKSPEAQRQRIAKTPYWLALYSDYNEEQPHIKTPQDLIKAYNIWDTWAMWQYGGVWWENGKSAPKHYSRGTWKTPAYFGTLDRPTERNGFNGSQGQLRSFWQKHSWAW